MGPYCCAAEHLPPGMFSAFRPSATAGAIPPLGIVIPVDSEDERRPRPPVLLRCVLEGNFCCVCDRGKGLGGAGGAVPFWSPMCLLPLPPFPFPGARARIGGTVCLLVCAAGGALGVWFHTCGGASLSIGVRAVHWATASRKRR